MRLSDSKPAQRGCLAGWWLDGHVSDISLQLLKHGLGCLGRVPLAAVNQGFGVFISLRRSQEQRWSPQGSPHARIDPLVAIPRAPNPRAIEESLQDAWVIHVGWQPVPFRVTEDARRLRVGASEEFRHAAAKCDAG